jgi:hypothetical protein
LDPINNATGECSVTPVYLIPSLFLYHLATFKDVSKDEWVHHILFGGCVGGAGLYFSPGPIQNACTWFMCGLPGGLDYAMLAAMKEGVMKGNAEKVWNARINVWVRSPGLIVTAYAMYIAYKHSKTQHIHPGALGMVILLNLLNGQYYMQKVVANTSAKVHGRGAC